MNTRLGAGRSASVKDEVATQVVDDVGGPDPELVRRFVVHYLADVDPGQLTERPVAELAGILTCHWRLGETMTASRASAIVPTSEGRHAVLSVMDDVPFLVDSLRAVLTRHDLAIHLTVHPMLEIRRDVQGHVVDLGGRDGVVEAWTLIEFDSCAPEALLTLDAEVASVLSDLAAISADREPMRARAKALAERVRVGSDPAGNVAASFLTWMTRQRFVFLGAASYVIDGELANVAAGSGLGLLASAHQPDPPLVVKGPVLTTARSEAHATVHRPARMTCIDVRSFGPGGTVIAIERFIGLFAASAYRESATEVPLLRDKVEDVLTGTGFPADSHAGRAVRAVLEALPRDDMFEMTADDLYDIATGIALLEERHVVRVFRIVEPGNRHVTCLVYLPRTRFTNDVAEIVADTVCEAFGGTERELDTVVSASALARIDVLVTRPAEPVLEPDLARLEARIDELTTGWNERLASLLGEAVGPEHSARLLRTFGAAIPPAYRAVTEPADAVEDLALIGSLGRHGDLRTSVQQRDGRGPAELRFTLYRRGEPPTLSAVLPYLEHLGVEVIDQQPFEFPISGDGSVWVSEIGLRLPDHVELDSTTAAEFQRTFVALYTGELENDGFNRLVVLAGLSARQTTVLRAYAKYLRQLAFPFGQASIERMLADWPAFAGALIELFEVRFDPALQMADRAERVGVLDATIGQLLDAVPGLDEDRIGRALWGLVNATLRTNAFRPADGGGHRPVLAFKFDPSRIAEMPLPRPKFEIFVYSPRVEGVHLRGGRIARGGLRWSDRREDFRTEVLGLMKAQMVKNAVIVPVGAKGGFVVKRSPVDAEQRRSEVVECYRMFVAGLLDLTDDIVGGVVVPPPATVRYDTDDPYLVVAADKGTATFSDTANAISADYGFWLGDAFASGGSAGYDHKAMGITARGAWESVRRHARAVGIDADADQMSVVGIGDMSGDVFGNGMLCSPNLRLIAAFDHRHVFIDPTPEPAAAYAERQRLFGLPRSSWDDYDRSLLSPGGGVFPRSAKAISVSAEARSALGIDADHLTPNELISAVLRAPVDLLWNGGIGTYVKASTETDLAVGDRANDAVRIDGRDLRCRMVGEGGNLGFTQLARVEYSIGGGLINTDAIDNSAGVDCSDHEVNIKILLNEVVEAGRLGPAGRNELLAAMTADIGELVLADNRAQTRALSIARSQTAAMVNVHRRYITHMEREGWFDRQIEFLPSDKQLAERQANGAGLTVPELAVLFAHTKLANISEILESNLADDPYVAPDLAAYFPPLLQEQFAPEIDRHRLRREIITTSLVNQMVNVSGTSFDHRTTEETGASSTDVLRAWVAARDIFGVRLLWSELEALNAVVAHDELVDAFRDARRMVERGVMWLLRRRRSPLDIGAAVSAFEPGVQLLLGELAGLVRGPLAEQTSVLAARRERSGFPEDAARRSAAWPLMHTAFDIVELATRHGLAPQRAAEVYWGVFDALDVTWLWNTVGSLPRFERWQTHARAAVRDELLTVLAELVDAVLHHGGDVDTWLATNLGPVERATEVFAEVRRMPQLDLTAVTVALRQLRNLVLSSGAERLVT